MFIEECIIEISYSDRQINQPYRPLSYTSRPRKSFVLRQELWNQRTKKVETSIYEHPNDNVMNPVKERKKSPMIKRFNPQYPFYALCEPYGESLPGPLLNVGAGTCAWGGEYIDGGETGSYRSGISY